MERYNLGFIGSAVLAGVVGCGNGENIPNEHRTSDAGAICYSSTDCEGLCTAPLENCVDESGRHEREFCYTLDEGTCSEFTWKDRGCYVLINEARNRIDCEFVP